MTTSDDNCGFIDLFGEDPTPPQMDMLRAVLDSLPDAVLAHGPDGRLLYFSQGACELLGYSRDEMTALRPFGWVAAESMRGSAGRLETILHEGHLSFESQVMAKDGSFTPTEVSARRVDTEGGPMIVAVIHDVSVRKRAQEELVFLAYHDALTGLSNRRAFEDRLRAAIAEAKRHDDILGLAYLDLDHFKPVNDRYGHEVGDHVLMLVSQRLVASVRTQDMIARLGGDEFVILLPRLQSADELEPLANRMLDAIRQPIHTCGVDCGIDATIGFALFDPASDDARSLLTKADAAMYVAKHDPAHDWILWRRGITGAHSTEAE